MADDLNKKSESNLGKRAASLESCTGIVTYMYVFGGRSSTESSVTCIAYLAFHAWSGPTTASRSVQPFLHCPPIYAAHGLFNRIHQVAPVSTHT